MFERDCKPEITVKILLEKYNNEMTNKGTYFCSKLKRWYSVWERKLNKVSEEIEGASKTRKKVDGKPNSLGIIEVLIFANTDLFPNICKLLILGATSPIGSTEAERAASGIR